MTAARTNELSFKRIAIEALISTVLWVFIRFSLVWSSVDANPPPVVPASRPVAVPVPVPLLFWLAVLWFSYFEYSVVAGVWFQCSPAPATPSGGGVGNTGSCSQAAIGIGLISFAHMIYVVLSLLELPGIPLIASVSSPANPDRLRSHTLWMLVAGFLLTLVCAYALLALRA